jgi:cytochrome c-type biogenesis protein CcmH
MTVVRWALLLLIVWPRLAYADPIDDGVRRVALQLQCPVCEGQNVADSNSGLARDMRALIRTRVEADVPDQQILDEFVASYGDGILTEPPKRGIALGVWIGPVAGCRGGCRAAGSRPRVVAAQLAAPERIRAARCQQRCRR